MPTMPVGTEFFDELVSGQYYYVDKTATIKEFYDNKSKVTLITRPRRFGKTLFMQMLKEFFSLENAGKQDIFAGLAISRDKEFCVKHQNKYPVMFITLKEIKSNTFEEARKEFSKLLANLADRYYNSLEPDKLTKSQQKWLADFHGIERMDLPWASMSSALKTMTEILESYYGMKPIVLIDEYDTPIQTAWQYGYYDDMISFMKVFLGNILKTNPAMSFAVLTGVMRISKESIFSDLNNLDVNTVTSKNLNTIMGFTEAETIELAKEIKADNKLPEIKQWYNGYDFGGQQIYNPFSVVKYFKEHCTPDCYWINTSSNGIIKDMLKSADKSRIEALNGLLQGKSIHAVLMDKVVYGDIFTNEDAMYTMLLTTGYLKGISEEYTAGGIIYEMQIPNLEIYKAYEKEIISYVTRNYSYMELWTLLEAMRNADAKQLQESLGEMLLRMTSVYDVESSSENRESFYHGLLLGLTAMLQNDYTIESNRESGYGRFDVALFPKRTGMSGVIMEFKARNKLKRWANYDKFQMDKALEPTCKKALEQINNREYVTEFAKRGIENVSRVGIAFCGKYVAVRVK